MNTIVHKLLLSMITMCLFCQGQSGITGTGIGKEELRRALDIVSPVGDIQNIIAGYLRFTWDDTGMQIPNNSSIHNIICSPDNRFFASGDFHHQARIWDYKTKKCIKILPEEDHHIGGIAFSPNGKYFAYGTENSPMPKREYVHIRIFDTQTFTCLYSVQLKQSRVQSLRFSPDSSCLLAGMSDDHSIKIFKVNESNNNISLDFERSLTGHDGFIYSLAFSPDKKKLVSSSVSCKLQDVVIVWDAQTFTPMQKFTIHAPGYCVAFSPDGAYFVVGTCNIVEVFKSSAVGFAHHCSLTDHGGCIGIVQYSPCGNYILVAGCQDSKMHLYTANDFKLSKTLDGGPFTATFTPDNKHIIFDSSNAVKFLTQVIDLNEW